MYPVFSVDRSIPIPSSLKGTPSPDKYVKVIRPATYLQEGCFSSSDVIRNEILLSIKAGEIGVGPRIWDAAQNDNGGILVMDRYDGTLEDLLMLYPTNRSIPMEEILKGIKILLEHLHQNRIVHRDFHPGNIFYTKGGIIAIGDYGNSLETDSQPYRYQDWHNYNEIVRIARLGLPYQKDSYYEVARPPQYVWEGLLIWNGKICSDWK